MKKVIAIVVVLLLVACGVVLLIVNKGKDENKSKDEANKPEIVGSWKLDNFIYTFNEDGTGKYDAAGTIMEFTYKTDGNKISILYTGNTEPFETEYSIDGDTLNVIDSFGSDTLYKKVK